MLKRKQSGFQVYGRVWVRLSYFMRSRRMHRFMATMAPQPGSRILDLGGQAAIWNWVDVPLEIVCVNLPGVGLEAGSGKHTIRHVEGDACDLDDAFLEELGHVDLVFSNSVIEHVGDAERRRAFAEQVQRVSDRYWIQTPSKYFPIEPHCRRPFWWFYPEWLRQRLLKRWSAAMPVWTEMVAGTVAVERRELQELFPDGSIRTERVLGWPKALIVHGGAGRTVERTAPVTPITAIGRPDRPAESPESPESPGGDAPRYDVSSR